MAGVNNPDSFVALVYPGGTKAAGTFVDDDAPLPALTSNRRKVLRNTPTIQAAAYALGDLVGGKQAFANAARVADSIGGIIEFLLIADNANVGQPFDLVFFDSDPSATTFTENEALDIADVDLDKVLAVVRLTATTATDFQAFVDNAVHYKQVAIPYVTAGGTTLFLAMLARGAMTFVATDDLQLTLTVRQD